MTGSSEPQGGCTPGLQCTTGSPDLSHGALPQLVCPSYAVQRRCLACSTRPSDVCVCPIGPAASLVYLWPCHVFMHSHPVHPHNLMPEFQQHLLCTYPLLLSSFSSPPSPSVRRWPWSDRYPTRFPALLFGVVATFSVGSVDALARH